MATELEKYLKSLPVEASDPEATRNAIIEAILSGDSPEEVFETPDLVSAEDVLDVPILVEDFRINQGDFGPYFVIDAILLGNGNIKTGEGRFVSPGERIEPGLSCGSEIVMAQLAKAKRMDWLPVRVRIIRRETGQGYHVLRMVADRGEDSVEATASVSE